VERRSAHSFPLLTPQFVVDFEKRFDSAKSHRRLPNQPDCRNRPNARRFDVDDGNRRCRDDGNDKSSDRCGDGDGSGMIEFSKGVEVRNPETATSARAVPTAG
jgi:hypothetical protein